MKKKGTRRAYSRKKRSSEEEKRKALGRAEGREFETEALREEKLLRTVKKERGAKVRRGRG